MPHSPTVTFAVAAISHSRCAVAADSLMVTIAAAAPTASLVTKTVGTPTLVGVVAGIVGTPSGTLNTALASALTASATVEQAADSFVAAAAAVIGPQAQHILSLFAEGGVVWEAVIAGMLDTGSTGGYLITAYVRDNIIDLHLRTVEAAASPQVVVLGARNAELHRYDLRYHEYYPNEVLVAGLTRSEPPSPPLAVATGSADELRALVSAAIDTAHLAQRPSWWPSAQPVAAELVTTASV